MLADDTLVYKKIHSLNDCRKFQQNLDSLSAWSKKWGMSFNISKSKIISFNSIGDATRYMLNESALDYVNSTKYLGVTLQSHCKFNKHL